MKHIKKLNEAITSNEEKARAAGYEIGDVVYNRKMGKNLTIISNEDYEKNYGFGKPTSDSWCTLGAVGEFPGNYSLQRKYQDIKKNLDDKSFNKINSAFDEVLSLIRSPKYQSFSDDEYLALMMKLKKWFNRNVIE